MPIPHLPEELLDHIVDFLYDGERVSRECCLVSKSWIPRTRKHLFVHAKFVTENDLKSWKKTFPDPLASPAHHAKAMLIGSYHVLRDVDADGGCWLRGFSNVVHLEVKMHDHDRLTGTAASAIPLVALHGFSPVIKSLYLGFALLSPSHIFDLILSFPLLEDLYILIFGGSAYNGDGPDGLPTVVQPQNPPTLTGTLSLFLVRGAEPITRRLLSLPGGIHFRKLTHSVSCEEDLPSIMELVEGCSHTLESVDITYSLPGTSIWHIRPHQ